MLGFMNLSRRLTGLRGPGQVPGFQPRRLVSGQFAIIRDSGHPVQALTMLCSDISLAMNGTTVCPPNVLRDAGVRNARQDFPCARIRETIAFHPCASKL